jgi:hypothetical protein
MRPSESIVEEKLFGIKMFLFYFLLRLEFSAALTLIMQFPRVASLK